MTNKTKYLVQVMLSCKNIQQLEVFNNWIYDLSKKDKITVEEYNFVKNYSNVNTELSYEQNWALECA
jgi:hypothetical protein